MDYIRKFDIELEKEYYYAGEKIKGWVIVENTENLKVRGIRVSLRGKAHVEWRITRGGERKSIKEDQYLVEDKAVIWGKDKHEEGSIPIMARGDHRFRFEFELPENSLPCSFESKMGTVRYYLRAVVDIPYASAPQGLKYFTVIGPHIDCMEEKYMVPTSVSEQSQICCLCCTCCPLAGPVRIDAQLERGAYCCGEHMRLKCDIHNSSDENVWLICRLTQIVEYHINKGALGLNKTVHHQVFEHTSAMVAPHSSQSFPNMHRILRLPVMPPTMLGVCNIIEIYYVLKIRLGLEKSGEDLTIDFPIEVGTVPFRIVNNPAPDIKHEPAAGNVEGGIYISPEFQLGQVYDGSVDMGSSVILYRPVYVTVNGPATGDDDDDDDDGRAASPDGRVTLPVAEKCTSV